jgi:hypothetical protein
MEGFDDGHITVSTSGGTYASGFHYWGDADGMPNLP